MCSSRGPKSRASLSTMRYLNEVERECTDLRRHLVTRVREQTAEVLVHHLNYEETKSPFDKVKQLCSQPRRRKKTRSSRQRALEMQMAMAQPVAPKRVPALFSTTSAHTVEASSSSFTSSSVKTGFSLKNLLRRSVPTQYNCAALDYSSTMQAVRSARSFVGEHSQGVETF